MITQLELKELLSYDKDTGIFRWVKRPGMRVNIGDIAGSAQDSRSEAIRIHISKRRYFASRLAWLYMTGILPKCEIEHINGDVSDNRFINLREVTRTENNKNTSLLSNNKSGYCGVYWSNKNSRFYAQIGVHGKKIHLGNYDNIIDAVIARKKAEGKFQFHENHGKK